MRKSISIILFLFFASRSWSINVNYSVSGRVGWIMPDGKVDKVVNQRGEWIGQAWSGDFSATFYPHWSSLRHWNDAGWGVGISYWNLPNTMLGHAIAPYTYMDIPFVKQRHFVFGLRPGIGAAFLTKTYRNTVPEGHLFTDTQDANECIGSVTNIYFPEVLYINIPIAKGWNIGIRGGWYHISNGSIRQPNSGYNIFGGEINVGYQVADNLSPQTDNNDKDTAKSWSVVVAATAGGRQVYYRDQQTFAVASIHAAAYWHAHPIFRLGGGMDVFYDGAYIQRPTYFQKTNLAAAQAGDCWRMGVSVQSEFVVGKFTTGLHIGAYLYDPVKELEPYSEAILSPTGRISKPIFYPYNLLKAGSAGYPDGWLYTMVVLRYHLPWHVFLQAMMKSHLTKVEFVSLGIGFYY